VPSLYHGVEKYPDKLAVQKCLDARRAKTKERGVSFNTSSDEVCSATPQMSAL
jgi:hypothetical protein